MQVIAPTTKRLCPHCGRDQIANSHFRGTIEEQVLRTLHLHAYRCCDCGKRFYGRRGAFRSPSSRAA